MSGGMKMKNQPVNSGLCGELHAGEAPERCCGKCRYCERKQGEKLRCRRHKIETYFAGMCRECEPCMAAKAM